ncbi:MAG: ribonuclease H-like domain-containing protein, partial [Candidatus Nanohaloarchaea archaeon]
EEIGIDRDLEDVDGREAIHLWKRYEKHGDEAALDRLVRYNRLDVVNLRPLLEEVHGKLRRDVFEPHLPG